MAPNSKKNSELEQWKKKSPYVVHFFQSPLILLFDIISEESARNFVGEILHITQ